MTDFWNFLAEPGTSCGDSYDDFPTIEEILYTTLRTNDFRTEDPSQENTVRGVRKAALEKRGYTDHGRSASGDDSGKSLGRSATTLVVAKTLIFYCGIDDPIILVGDNDSCASEAEVEADDIGLCTESAAPNTDQPVTAVDSTTPVPPSSDGWLDVDDFLETAARLPLIETGALTSNAIRPYNSPLRLSSEPLHDNTTAIDLHPRRARSEATVPYSARFQSPLPRCTRALPEKQLSQEGHLYTGRGIADEHALVSPVRSADLIEKRQSRQPQEVKQKENVDNKDSSSKREHLSSLRGASARKHRPLWKKWDILGTEKTERSQGDVDLLDWEADSKTSIQLKAWPRLSTREPLPTTTNHDKAECDSDSGDELNNSESNKGSRVPCPIKRKRPFSSNDNPTHKKRKYYLQQTSTCQPRPRAKFFRRTPKSPSVLDQASRVAIESSTENRLPSPALSAPQAIDSEMPSDCSDLGGSSGNILPTLVEVTFRPQTPHCCSFTAIIRDGCDRRGVSFGQLAQLIRGTSHVGRIDDFTIQPIEQHAFLVTGFSRQDLPRLSSSKTDLSTAVEVSSIHGGATRIRSQHAINIDAKVLASQKSRPSIRDRDSPSSDSDSESSSGNDGYSSEDEQGRSNTSKHSRWSDLDEQRLLAYKKEEKSWDWIFGKFKGRTPAAVRTRWTMVQHKVK
jgi:hypothetical protein